MGRRNRLPRRLPGHCPSYDPNRDTQWTRNSATILHWLDGGEVSIQCRGAWLPVHEVLKHKDHNSLNFFHKYPARPDGYKTKGTVNKHE